MYTRRIKVFFDRSYWGVEVFGVDIFLGVKVVIGIYIIEWLVVRVFRNFFDKGFLKIFLKFGFWFFISF